MGRLGCENRTERGFVLVSVLWILAILTVISLGFGRRAMMERKMAWYALDHAQAMQMARGAAERAIAELGNKYPIDLTQEKVGYTGPDQNWARPVNMLKGEGLYEASEDEDFDGERCGYRIYDASSKISINSAPEELLREVDGISTSAMRKINSRRRGGDEGDEIRSFLSIDEVRTLTGIDDRDWYGREPGTGLRDILDVWGNQVNINTAPAAVMHSIPDIRANVINGILDYRAGDDGELDTGDDRSFADFRDMRDKLGLSADRTAGMSRFCTTVSTLFRIEAYATRRGGKITARVTAIVQSNGGYRNVLVWNEDVFRT